jgi:hypothetical protein
MVEWNKPMSLIKKYFESFREVEKTTSGLPSIPRGIVKILMPLKVLTDLIGVLMILAIIVSIIGLVGKTIL